MNEEQNYEIEITTEEQQPVKEIVSVNKQLLTNKEKEPSTEGKKEAGEEAEIIDASGAENDDEAEQKRIANSEKRKRKRERQRAAQAALERRLIEQQERNAQLERRLNEVAMRQTQNEATQVENHIVDVASAIEQIKQQMADATERGDGAALVDATERFQEAKNMLARLQQRKSQFEKHSASQPMAKEDPQRQSKIQHYAKEFFERNTWVETTPTTQESAIIHEIGKVMVQRGMDPASPNYWRALEAEAQARFPGKYQDEDDQEDAEIEIEQPKAVQSRKIPVASGSPSGSSTANGKYKLTAQQKAALDQMADLKPERRLALIKNYHEYNEKNKNQRV